jgi:hypothetical protein
MKILSKLDVRVGQHVDELVVDVDKVVDHVMSHQRFFFCDQMFDNLSETHLLSDLNINQIFELRCKRVVGLKFLLKNCLLRAFH